MLTHDEYELEEPQDASPVTAQEMRVVEPAAQAKKIKVVPKPTEVRIIRQQNGMMLIQWNDGQLRRSWITKELAEQVDGDRAWVVSPERGIPFGDDFSSIIQVVQVTPQMFDAEFKRRGIWTFDDLLARQGEVLAVVQTVYGPSLSAIYRAVGLAAKARSK